MIYWEILLGDEDVKGKLERLYKDFGGAGPLASHLGISTITLRKKLHELKIPMMSRGGPHFRLERERLPDRWWNMSTEQLSRISGYSLHYVRRLKREKLCQLGQSTKIQTQDSSSDTSPAKSSSQEPDEE